MNEQLGIALVQHLAWPAVALIAFIGFRRNVVDLATGAGKLHDLLKNPHEILELLDKIEKAQKALKDEIKTTQEAVDDLAFKDESRDAPPVASASVEATPAEMFEKIKHEWDAIVDDIRRRAEGVGAKTKLVGYVGVNATIDELVTKGAMPADAAQFVKDVSNRWQPMMRNQRRLSDWLTPQLFRSFMQAAGQAKTALGI